MLRMPCGLCLAAMVRFAYRVVGSGLDRVGAGDYCGCAATIVTVHELSSRRPNSRSRLGASATVMQS